jgi:hypothetical protein
MTCSGNLPSGFKSTPSPNFHFIRGTRRPIDDIAISIIETSNKMPKWRKFSFTREYQWLIIEWFISGLDTDQIAKELRKGNDFRIQSKEVLTLISDIEAAVTLEMKQMYKSLLEVTIEKEQPDGTNQHLYH